MPMRKAGLRPEGIHLGKWQNLLFIQPQRQFRVFPPFWAIALFYDAFARLFFVNVTPYDLFAILSGRLQDLTICLQHLPGRLHDFTICLQHFPGVCKTYNLFSRPSSVFARPYDLFAALSRAFARLYDLFARPYHTFAALFRLYVWGNNGYVRSKDAYAKMAASICFL